MRKLASGVLGIGAAVAFAQGDQAAKPAVPLDPVTAIIEALATHQVVALGDWHHNVQLHDVRLRLLRDPRLPDVVNDIVVEFGTPRHQDVIDRYIDGSDVAHDDLRRVWTETSQGGVWDGPVYEEFYDTVREVNASLPADRRIRVVLGDPTPLTMEAEAELIRREVIAKGRNALIVYGNGHLPRKPRFYPVSDLEFAERVFADPDYSISTVAHLEAANISVFSMFASTSDEFVDVQSDIKAWPRPALALVAGTTLGLEPFATFSPKDTRLWVPDANGGHPEAVRPDPARSGLTQEQFDAVLLLGPAGSMVTSEPRGPGSQN